MVLHWIHANTTKNPIIPSSHARSMFKVIKGSIIAKNTFDPAYYSEDSIYDV